MRVPVYPDDLKPKSGFKGLSKKLQRGWIGSSPITLAAAREVFAKGLGYADYHDLRRSSELARPGAIVPTEAQVRHSIAKSIKTVLQPSQVLLNDDSVLERFVSSLPLTALVAFKSPLRRETLVIAGASRLHVKRTATLSKLEIQSIADMLVGSGNLRDQALFACMVAGLRTTKYLHARLPKLVMVKKHKVFVFEGLKLHAVLPLSCSAAIDRYIAASNLLEEDYLFSSARDPKSPMTPGMLSRICSSWALRANLEAGLFTPKNLRESAIIQALADVPRIDVAMGHIPLMHTSAYVSEILT